MSQKNSNGCVFCAHERAFCPLFFCSFTLDGGSPPYVCLFCLRRKRHCAAFSLLTGRSLPQRSEERLRLPKRGVGGSSFCVTRATKNSPPAFGGIFLRMHGARSGISCFRARPCADFCICVAQRGNCFAPSCGGLAGIRALCGNFCVCRRSCKKLRWRQATYPRLPLTYVVRGDQGHKPAFPRSPHNLYRRAQDTLCNLYPRSWRRLSASFAVTLQPPFSLLFRGLVS